MRIKPNIGSVVGQTSDTAWGQVLLTPQAYGVIEIQSETGLARQLGINILTHLAQALMREPKSLKEVEQIADATSEQKLTSLILLVPVGQVLYLVVRTGGAVYLKRGEKISPLLVTQGAVSGEVKTGDTVLVVSDSFTRAFAAEDLAGVFDHLSALEAAEKLTLLLHEKTNGYGAAALVFQVSELIPLEAEEVKSVRSVAQPSPMERILKRTREKGVSFARRSLPRQLRLRLSPLRHKLGKFFSGGNPVIIVIALIFCLLFVFSVVLGLRRQLVVRRDRETVRVLGEAQRVFDEGVALLTLSPVKGRERLREAKNLLEIAQKTVSARSKQGRELAGFYQKVLDNLTQAMQIFKQEPTLYFDASLLKKGASINSFALWGDLLGLVDQGGKTIYTLALSSRKAEVVGGGQDYPVPLALTLSADKIYVLTSSGINLIRLSDKKAVPLVINKDSQWGNIASLVAFGGNLYLLDTAKSRIWKYVGTGTGSSVGGQGFSELREYLNPDTLPTLTGATTLAIDGSVWVGTKEGKIWRFTQGKENTFLPQGVEPALGQNLSLYLSDSTKNLYLLDNQNKRVVVLDKDGIYLAQYVWEGNLALNGLAVSETAKKILLLAEGKIFFLELK